MIQDQMDLDEAKRREETLLGYKGDVSQVILDNFDSGPRGIIAALLSNFTNVKLTAPGADEKFMFSEPVKTELRKDGSRVIFEASVDNNQFQYRKNEGADEIHPGSRELNVKSRRAARNKAVSEVQEVAQVLDELRIPYTMRAHNFDNRSGWRLTIQDKALDAALNPVGMGDLSTEEGRNAAMAEFWRALEARPEQAYGQEAGSKAATTVAARFGQFQEQEASR